MKYTDVNNHPRLLELQFMIIYDDLIRAFGIEGATNFIEAICSSFHLNYSLISGVVSKRMEILALKHTDLRRYRQELLILGLSKGYSRTYIATNIMKISRQTFYAMYSEALNPDEFFTKEWVEEMNYTTVSLGVKAYANEVFRFVKIIDALKGIM